MSDEQVGSQEQLVAVAVDPDMDTNSDFSDRNSDQGVDDQRGVEEEVSVSVAPESSAAPRSSISNAELRTQVLKVLEIIVQTSLNTVFKDSALGSVQFEHPTTSRDAELSVEHHQIYDNGATSLPETDNHLTQQDPAFTNQVMLSSFDLSSLEEYVKGPQGLVIAPKSVIGNLSLQQQRAFEPLPSSLLREIQDLDEGSSEEDSDSDTERRRGGAVVVFKNTMPRRPLGVHVKNFARGGLMAAFGDKSALERHQKTVRDEEAKQYKPRERKHAAWTASQELPHLLQGESNKNGGISFRTSYSTDIGATNGACRLLQATFRGHVVRMMAYQHLTTEQKYQAIYRSPRCWLQAKVIWDKCIHMKFFEEKGFFMGIKLCQVAVLETFEQFEMVCQEGDKSSCFYVVHAGGVDILKDGIKVARLNVGDSFGEMGLIRGTRRAASCLSTGKGMIRGDVIDPHFDRDNASELLRIDKDHYMSLLKSGDEEAAAEKAHFLKTLKFFEECDSVLIDALGHVCYRRVCAPGEIVVPQGRILKSVLVLESGELGLWSCSASVASNLRKKGLRGAFTQVLRGQFLGDHEALTSTPTECEFTAMAGSVHSRVEGATILEITASEFQRFVKAVTDRRLQRRWWNSIRTTHSWRSAEAVIAAKQFSKVKESVKQQSGEQPATSTATELHHTDTQPGGLPRSRPRLGPDTSGLPSVRSSLELLVKKKRGLEAILSPRAKEKSPRDALPKLSPKYIPSPPTQPPPKARRARSTLLWSSSFARDKKSKTTASSAGPNRHTRDILNSLSRAHTRTIPTDSPRSTTWPTRET